MNLEEYLYVDEKRLDTYTEQIGSTVKFEKVPIWSVKFSLTGPEAGGTQQRFQMPLTRQEKVDRLVYYLKEKSLLGDGRLLDRERTFTIRKPEAPFRLETCDAVRVFIPPVPALNPRSQLGRKRLLEQLPKKARDPLHGFSGLNIWFSDRHHASSSNAECRGQLLLIVGFPKDDVAHYEARSAYSALQSLVDQLGSEVEKTILHDLRYEQPEMASSLQKRFAADPIPALEAAGAEVAGWRTITTLYRVRQAVVFNELDDDRETIATIGYPIYITAQDL